MAARISETAAARSSSASQSRARGRAIPGGERSMKGCIAKDDKGNYLLVPQKGAKVILNNPGDVAGHVGQQVKISGAFLDPREPIDKSKPEPKTQILREFRVMKLDVLAPTCTAPATKKKK